jgi:hypothetical protein
MIEREISIRTVGQTKRIEMISTRIYTVYVYVRVDVWRVSIVQVRVNLCTMNGWREERQRQKKKISSLLSPILEHVSYICACLSLFVNLVVHTFSISQLIIFNCSLVDHACESLLKINVYLFHSFLEFILQTTILNHSVHCYILLSKQNMTMTFYSLLWTILILFSAVEHL